MPASGRNQKTGESVIHWDAIASAGIALLLGAVSPGPSLAVVIRASLTGGRTQGVACAIGHGAGFGLYAVAVVFGLGITMAQAPTLFRSLQWCGVLLLIYLAWKTLASKPAEAESTTNHSSAGFAEGFLTAFLNPKIALFFLAVFSAVLVPDMPTGTQVQIACLGWMIDTSWYTAVAWIASGTTTRELLNRHRKAIDVAMTVVLLGLAAVTTVRLVCA